MRAAMLCLNEDRRQVLLGKYVDGLTVSEIAARTSRTEKAVEPLLSRARGSYGACSPIISRPNRKGYVMSTNLDPNEANEEFALGQLVGEAGDPRVERSSAQIVAVEQAILTAAAAEPGAKAASLAEMVDCDR